MILEHHKHCKPTPACKITQSHLPPLSLSFQDQESICLYVVDYMKPFRHKANYFHLKQLMELQSATVRFSFYLAFIRFLALSSQCSDTVRSSCSFAIAFSTAGQGASPTPESIRRLISSRVREFWSEEASCTSSSQRACSRRIRSSASWGKSTSKSKLTSNSSWSSAAQGISSERSFWLCC